MTPRVSHGTVDRRLAIGLAMTLGVAAAALVVWTLPEPSERVQPKERPAGRLECDLNDGPCRTILDGVGVVELEVTPRPLRLLEPLTVEARFERAAAVSDVTVTATSTTMDMGVTRFSLLPTDSGAFVGQGSLPVCVSDHLAWTARLDFQLEGMLRTTSFGFTTHRRVGSRPDGARVSGEEVAHLDGPVVEFALRSAQGPVRLSDFRGKVVLLYFGYTSCPDVCPTSLTATARALRQLTPEQLAKVQTIFVSVDPERDTPEHLAEYSAFFHPSMIGVTGTDAEVAEAARPFGVVYARQKATGATGYVVDHSAYTYLIAPDGHLASRLPHAAPAGVVVAELKPWLPRAASPVGATKKGSP